MKLSKSTIEILKNFSSINSNILFNEGNVLKTISPQRTVLASVTVEDTFPQQFGIYDLNQFLNVLSLFNDPDVQFTEKTATIKEGKTSIKFNAADQSVLFVPPEKQVKFPSSDVSFELTAAQLTMAIKTAGVLKCPDISIVGDGSSLQLIVGDLKNSASNSYNVVLGETTLDFKANLKIDNLKMLTQDYLVDISSKKLSRWVAKSNDMTVFVALEATSSFNS